VQEDADDQQGNHRDMGLPQSATDLA